MTRKKAFRFLLGGAVLLSTAAAAYPWSAWLNANVMNGKVFGYYYSSTYHTLFSFGPTAANRQGGSNPVAGLTPGNNALFGTTTSPGRAFEIYPQRDAKADWAEEVLASLQGGSLFALTAIDANQLAGTENADVFLLTNDGTRFKKSIIATFAGSTPSSGITAGPDGTLYGTATGGPNGNGFVYQLTPQPGGGYAESTLLAFKGGIDGAQPQGGVVFGPGGLLYGATAFGGTIRCIYQFQLGCGTIYSLSLTGTERVLHRFAGKADGAGPGELTVDSHGDIVGATTFGGFGTIFRLQAQPQKPLQFSVIYAFQNGADGRSPNTKLAVDSDGAIYGTARDGGAGGYGTAFVLVPPLVAGPTWNFAVLHAFTGVHGKDNATADGATPRGGLLIDTTGALYGVTEAGGLHGDGSAYKLVP